MKNFTIAFTISLIFLLSSCEVEHQDISSNPPYSEIIGKTFKTDIKLIIHGVLEVLGDENSLGGYTVKAPPGVSGPEIMSRTEIDPGSSIKILKAMGCKGCNSKTVYFIVEVAEFHAQENIPIWLEMELTNFDQNKQMRVLRTDIFTPM